MKTPDYKARAIKFLKEKHKLSNGISDYFKAKAKDLAEFAEWNDKMYSNKPNK